MKNINRLKKDFFITSSEYDRRKKELDKIEKTVCLRCKSLGIKKVVWGEPLCRFHKGLEGVSENPSPSGGKTR